MRLDHSAQVLDFAGQPLLHQDRELTFRDIVILSLNTVDDGEKMGAEAKAKCYQMTAKFFHGKRVKLTVDEAAFIKERAGVVITSPLAFGRLCEWLEGEPQALGSDEDEPDDEPPTST